MCLSHVVKWISHTHLGSGSSHSMTLQKTPDVTLKNDSHTHTIQYWLIDGECTHLLCKFMTKAGNCGNNNYLQLSLSHVIMYLYVVAKGELCHNMMKWLWEFLSHVVKWHPHTYMGVILWYNEITPGMLISRKKNTPAHQAIRSHPYWLYAFV